ncbi:hypothetical protein [Salibacterium aidingense]|uniref:hypothetical protein n=1 Tax=Salibacterium aidingense TaxID=384933 RepID=UPI003BCE10CE
MASVNNRKQPKSADWRNLPIDSWNCTTFTAMLTELTADHFGVDYAPGGGGSKSQRWAREKGMLKQAQQRYGNAILRRFIEMCVEEYRPNSDYPFPTFAFMYSYMDRNFARAQAEIAAAERQAQAEDNARQAASSGDMLDYL